MSYNVHRFFFIGGAALAVVFLLLTVALFFLLKIPKVYGYLSGSTKRKGVESIRNKSEAYEGKAKNPLPFLRDTGKLSGGTRTGSFGRHAVVSPPEAAPASPPPASETAILSQSDTPSGGAVRNRSISDGPSPSGGSFAIEYEITFIHTDEVIA